MNNLSFNGGILLNGFLIDLTEETIFKKGILETLSADQLSIKEYNGYITYSFLCEYIKSKFRFYITFHEKNRNSDPYLVWNDGICAKQGWESSEKDLFLDVNNLKNILEMNGFLPYDSNENLTFYYNINETKLVLSGSLRSMIVFLGLEIE